MSPTTSTPSPWQLALGEGYDALHPRLRAYFGSIPPGSVGRGQGVFDVVGTPRRWLWPAFAALASAQVLFPVWQKQVAFTVLNTPGEALTAERTFAFAAGDRTMLDAVRWSDGRLHDVLGSPQRVCVRLSATVVDGELHLASTGSWLIFAGVRLPIPPPLAPRMNLVESIGADDRQHVAFTLTAPLIGTLYEYRGSFDYRIEAA
ncbi:hypothetical protein BH11ACT3_BH11ACT3_16320 [soil metagenome]